ncbi:MAG: hypothetical protein IJ553_01845 [Alloprevotella sp.]|nr:hypothetical protein [Alloprevotella sp.]
MNTLSKTLMTILILAAVAVMGVGIGYMGPVGIIAAGAVFTLLLLIYISLQKKTPVEPAAPTATLDDSIAQYGEPLNIVVVNPMRSNEPIGALLDYPNILVYDHTAIEKARITAVTFNNAAVAQLPDSYQLLIVVDGQDHPVHVPLGNDIEWAKDVYRQVATLLQTK